MIYTKNNRKPNSFASTFFNRKEIVNFKNALNNNYYDALHDILKNKIDLNQCNKFIETLKKGNYIGSLNVSNEYYKTKTYRCTLYLIPKEAVSAIHYNHYYTKSIDVYIKHDYIFRDEDVTKYVYLFLDSKNNFHFFTKKELDSLYYSKEYTFLKKCKLNSVGNSSVSVELEGEYHSSSTIAQELKKNYKTIVFSRKRDKQFNVSENIYISNGKKYEYKTMWFSKELNLDQLESGKFYEASLDGDNMVIAVATHSITQDKMFTLLQQNDSLIKSKPINIFQ